MNINAGSMNGQHAFNQRQTDEQLLASLVGPCVAKNLLASSQGALEPIFAQSRKYAYSPIHLGVACEQIPYDSAPAVTLAAAWELVTRTLAEKIADCDCLIDPSLLVNYCRTHLFAAEREVFICLFLDNTHRLIATMELLGTLSQVSVAPREVVKACLIHNAAKLVVCHNHPSGRCRPSRADMALTKAVKEACAVVDIDLCDHVIVTNTASFSFAQQGII